MSKDLVVYTGRSIPKILVARNDGSMAGCCSIACASQIVLQEGFDFIPFTVPFTSVRVDTEFCIHCSWCGTVLVKYLNCCMHATPDSTVSNCPDRREPHHKYKFKKKPDAGEKS